MFDDLLYKIAIASIALISGGDFARAVETMPLTEQTSRNARIMPRPGNYDYAPSFMQDGSVYRMYWCGTETRAGIKSDYILHAQAASPEGPWHSAVDKTPGSYDVVFSPSLKSGTFDRIHVCDPTVMKTSEGYYLYYGGLSGHENSRTTLTAIGVAKGSTPLGFTRLNDGRPVIQAAQNGSTWVARKLFYGAGQPSVTYRAPYYYLIYTDTTAQGSNPGNGAGQYVVRSRSPAFDGTVEELSSSGWVERANTTALVADRSVLEAFSVDIAFDSQSDSFVIAQQVEGPLRTRLNFAAADWRIKGTTALPHVWQDGAAILAAANRVMPLRPRCGSLAIHLLTGAPPGDVQITTNPWAWDITYSAGTADISKIC